jgi:hypothetical protein
VTPRLVAAFLATALYILPSAPAASQGLSSWFDRAPEAVTYAPVRPALEAAAARLVAAGLPDDLIAARLVEGSRKRVAPERLAAAIEAEVRRYVSIAETLSSRALLPSRAPEAGKLAAQAELLMRGGASLAELAAALDAKARNASPRASPDQVALVARALDAVAAVYSVHVRFALEEGERESLAAALSGSSLDNARFPSVLSVFTKYRAAGLASSRICSLCVEILRAGGSLERIERELQRRIGKP